MDPKVLVLDLDDTLIRSDPSGPTAITYDTIQENISARPGLGRFLEGARRVFTELLLCTFSPRSRVEALLDSGVLPPFFDEILSRENMDEFTGSYSTGDFLLIDDRDILSGLTLRKLAALGLPIEEMTRSNRRRHLLRVKPFENDDDELEKIGKQLGIIHGDV